MTTVLRRGYGLLGAITLGCCMLVPAKAEQLSNIENLHRAVIEADLSRLIELHDGLGPFPEEQDAAYLWAYSGWRVAQVMGDEKKRQRKKLLKTLDENLRRHIERYPDDSEALSLLGSVLGDRISGPLSAIRLGGKAAEFLDRAHGLEPDNPRVALQRGVGYFFAPKAFGGGVEKAEVELIRALELFEGEQASEWPNWGYAETLARLGEVYAKQKKWDDAQGMYEKALTQEPDYAWVKNELVPALERRKQ